MEKYTRILMFLSLLCVVAIYGSAADTATILSLAEAKILVVASPVGQDLQKENMDIGFELQDSSQLNQADYYYFWVYNSKRANPAGSVTIGYYAVNKHTADLWDIDTRRIISGKLLESIQRIIREAHGIDSAIIKHYRTSRF